MKPTTARKPGPSLRVSLIVLAVGAVLTTVAIIVTVVHGVTAINPPSVATPSVTTRHLGKGRWVIFERTDERSPDGFTFNGGDGPDLDLSQVKVTGPDGIALPLDYDSADDSITNSSGIYVAAIEFEVPRAGRYSVAITTSGPGSVLITRSLGDTIRSVVLPLAAAGVSGVVVVVGLILLLVGIIRRSRVPRPAITGPWPPGGSGASWSPAAAGTAWSGPPPGWYPDPQLPGRQRWWDGTGWTAHQL